MITSRFFIPFLISLFTFSLFANGPKNYQEMVDKEISKKSYYSLSVAVIREQGTQFFNAGRKDKDDPNSKPDENTMYAVGSLTKVFTSQLLLLLDQQKKMDKDDLLQDVVPNGIDVPTKGGKKISLIQMTNHTSCLPHEYDDETENDPHKAYDYLDSLSLICEPGKEFNYSNFALGLLGLVMSDRTKTPYDQLLKDNFFTPLQMTRSGMDLIKGDKNFAYMYWDDGQRDTFGRSYFHIFNPAGGLLTTAKDLSMFLQTYLGIINTDFYNKIKSNLKPTTKASGERVGYGWFFDKLNGKTVLFHDGMANNYVAYFAIVPDKKVGIAVLATLRDEDASVYDIGEEILEDLIDHPTISTNSNEPKNQTIIHCKSDNYNFKSCSIPNVNLSQVKIKLFKQFSKTKCVENVNFGLDSKGIFVDKGCEGDFEVLTNGSNTGEGPKTINVHCKSENYGLNICSISNIDSSKAQIKLTQQLSNTKCVANVNYGLNAKGLFVDKGCEGNFEVSTTASNVTVNPKTVTVHCKSDSFNYKLCSVSNIDMLKSKLKLIKQFSRTKCVEKVNYGLSSKGVFVNNGCEGDFEVTL